MPRRCGHSAFTDSAALLGYTHRYCPPPPDLWPDIPDCGRIGSADPSWFSLRCGEISTFHVSKDACWTRLFQAPNFLTTLEWGATRDRSPVAFYHRPPVVCCLTTAKIAEFAPIHNANVKSAVKAKARSRQRSLSPNRRSWSSRSIRPQYERARTAVQSENPDLV